MLIDGYSGTKRSSVCVCVCVNDAVVTSYNVKNPASNPSVSACLQMLVMRIPGLCTQTTTMICLVQTTWRSSLIGQHISKPWCHSCVILFLFVYATYLNITFIPLGHSCLPSASVYAEKRNKSVGRRILPHQSVARSPSLLSMLRRGSCSKPSFTSAIIRGGSLRFSGSLF